MFRRWKWFRRRRRSASAQRAADAALRDDRLVREALDDYVRDVFSGAASPASASGAASRPESPSRPRCSLRRLPLDSAPKGHGRWNLDEKLLYGGHRHSYTVLYLSPTTSQPDAGTSESAAAFSCDCSEQSSCPHSSGEVSTGDQPRRVVETTDASTQFPVPRKPFRPWKQEKKTEEEPEPTSNEKAVQVDRSDFILTKSSQTDTPRRDVEVEDDTEEPTAQVSRSQSATPGKSGKAEEDTEEPTRQVSRSQGATPRKRSKEEEDPEELTTQATRSQSATPRKRSKEEEEPEELTAQQSRSQSANRRKSFQVEEDTEEPTSQVSRSQRTTPRKRSIVDQDAEEPTRQGSRSKSVTPRKRSKVEVVATEEPTAGPAVRTRVLSESYRTEAVTQTEEQPSQQTVVRLLPGPSGLPTIVIESTGNWQYVSPTVSSSSDVAVQVRTEHLVAAAGEAARASRPGERRSKLSVDRQASRSKTLRSKEDVPRSVRGSGSAVRRATRPAEGAPERDDGTRSPGSMRWSEWDDRQSPWVATQKYTIRHTNQESNDSEMRTPTSSQYVDRSIAEESQPPPAARGSSGLVLREYPAAAPRYREPVEATPATCPAARYREPVDPAPPTCPGTGCPAEREPRRRRRPCSPAASPPQTPPATPTRPATPPGLRHPNVKRHDCVGHLQDPPNSGGQPPR